MERAYVSSTRRTVVLLAAFLGMVALVASDAAKADPPAKADAPPKADTPAKGDKPSADPSAGTRELKDADVIAYINEEIEKQWKENKIRPSAPASDYEFTRRVFLDILGRIPTSNPDPTAPKEKDNPQTEARRIGEVQYFLEKSNKVSHAKIIEYLLRNDDYPIHWADMWTNWLLTRHSPPGIDRDAMHLWLEGCFAEGKRYDKMVEEIISATGKANEPKTGAVNFVLSHVGEIVPPDKRDRDGQFEMVPVTSRTAKLFLGVHLQCTQCHIHPFIDGRKQHDYWGINAFYRQVERQPANIMLRRQDSKDQFYTLRDNLGANPEAGIFFEQRAGTLVRTPPIYTLSDGTRIPITNTTTTNRRQELAKLVTHDPRFARAIVNRMWHHFFGRGFTKTVDELEDKENDPISHPELLDRLAQDFAKSGYDMHRLIRWICNSRAYQLSSVATDSNKAKDKEMYFSRMLLKAMSPEQLVESIFIATNAKQSHEKGAYRKMRDEWLKDFSVNFGDDEGNEASFNGTVVQALMLMNGKRLNEAIQTKSESTLHHAMASGGFGSTLKHIYLAALTRPPTGGEEGVAQRVAGKYGTGNPVGLWQDVLWALLNSNEFVLNH